MNKKIINKQLPLFIFGWLLFFPVQLLAEKPHDQSPKTLDDLDILQVITPMFLVVVLIFALAWAVKKMQRGIPALGKDIEILSSTPLSSQSRLCLIRVAGKDMLIGVTSAHISHLHTFDEPVPQKQAKPPAREFAEQFKNLVSRKND